MISINNPILDTGVPSIVPQKVYNWEVLLPDIGGQVGSDVSKYCQSLKCGQYDFGEISEVKAGAYKTFFAGELNIETAALTFVVPVPDVVTLYFQRWRTLIIDDNGYYYPANNYKRDIRANLYSNKTLCDVLLMKNAFPIKFPAYDVSYDKNTLLMVDVTFKFDKLILEHIQNLDLMVNQLAWR